MCALCVVVVLLLHTLTGGHTQCVLYIQLILVNTLPDVYVDFPHSCVV